MSGQAWRKVEIPQERKAVALFSDRLILSIIP